MLRICTSVPENFSETKFCFIIEVDDVINRAKYFFNRITRVSLARGQNSPFSVQSVGGHYNCCTTVQLWWTFLNPKKNIFRNKMLMKSDQGQERHFNFFLGGPNFFIIFQCH